MEQMSGPPQNEDSCLPGVPVSDTEDNVQISAVEEAPAPVATPPAVSAPAAQETPAPVRHETLSPSLDEQSTRLDHDLEESRRECTDLKSRLDVEKNRVDELIREHGEKNDRLRIMDQEVEKLRIRLTEVVQLENQWQAREDEWVAKVKALEEQREKAETISKALQEEKANAQAALINLKAETESTQQAAQRMQTEIGAAAGEKEKAALKIEELRLTLHTKDDQLQVALERERNTCAQTVKEEREKRTILETEIEQARQEIISLQEQVRAAAEESRRADQLRSEMANQESEKQALAEEISHHQDEISMLKNKLEDQNSRFDKIKLIFKKKNRIIEETGEFLEKRDALVKELREKLGKYEYWDKNNKFLLQTLQEQLGELSDAARILGIKKFVEMSARLSDTLSQIEWE